jgi:hypothetical protein
MTNRIEVVFEKIFCDRDVTSAVHPLLFDQC